MYEYIFQVFQLCKFLRPIHNGLSQNSIRSIQRMDSTFKNLLSKYKKNSSRKHGSKSTEDRFILSSRSVSRSLPVTSKSVNQKENGIGKFIKKLILLGMHINNVLPYFSPFSNFYYIQSWPTWMMIKHFYLCKGFNYSDDWSISDFFIK